MICDCKFADAEFLTDFLIGKSLTNIMDYFFFSISEKALYLYHITAVFIWLYGYRYGFFSMLFKFTHPTGLTEAILAKIYGVVTHAISRGAIIFLAITIILYLFHKHRLSHTTMNVILIGITVIDIWSFSMPLVMTYDLKNIKDKEMLLRPLEDDRGLWRGMVAGSCLIENAGLWYRFHDIQGYDPLIPKRYIEYINRSQQLPPDNKVVNMHYIQNWENPLIDLLNLKYVVHCDSGRIVKRKNVTPRAFIVHKMVQKNEENILDYMMGPEFNPLEVVVYGPKVNIPAFESNENGPVQTYEFCLIDSYSHDSIIISADLSEPGFLILSEINYPGWHVFVDDEKETILTGNYLFRTVPLQAGSHTVRFEYRPVSFRWGLRLSLLTLFFILVYLMIDARIRMKRKWDFNYVEKSPSH